MSRNRTALVAVLSLVCLCVAGIGSAAAQTPTGRIVPAAEPGGYKAMATIVPGGYEAMITIEPGDYKAMATIVPSGSSLGTAVVPAGFTALPTISP